MSKWNTALDANEASSVGVEQSESAADAGSLIRITRQTAFAGQLMLQYGADGALVEETCHRLATALGCHWADISITANALVITTHRDGQHETLVRRVVEQGIHMGIVCSVRRTALLCEKGILDIDDLAQRLKSAKQSHPVYPRMAVVAMIALACASFAHLFGADHAGMAFAGLAAAIGLWVRQQLHHWRVHPYLIVLVAGMVSTSISAVAAISGWSQTPKLAMAASVLYLVPGFPLINAVSDLARGYINVGWSRWVQASMLVLFTCLGIVLGMNLVGVWGWL